VAHGKTRNFTLAGGPQVKYGPLYFFRRFRSQGRRIAAAEGSDRSPPPPINRQRVFSSSLPEQPRRARAQVPPATSPSEALPPSLVRL
jgi:hypothetical protein